MFPTTSKATRFVTYLIDRFLWSCITVAIVLTFTFTIGEVINIPIIPGLLGFSIIGLVIHVAYYFVAEWKTGRTPGKYVTGTRVLTTQASPLTADQAFKRSLARLVPFSGLSILSNNNDRAWIDTFSHTVVVNEKNVPPQYRAVHPVGARVATIIACIVLFISPIVALIIDMAYDSATGGERIDIPATMPTDLRLTDFQKFTDSDADYYRLTYTGDNRTIEITRLIAGYNYGGTTDCIYTVPTPRSASGLGFVPMDPNLKCESLAKGTSIDDFSAYTVSGQSSSYDTRNITPDYILSDAPFRYAIKATSGSISRKEVTAMTTGSVTKTADELKSEAARNQAAATP